MDTTDQDLRRALTSRERGRGVRIPAELKSRAAAYARRRRRQGASLRDLADELSLSGETIRRWTTGVPVAAARPVPVEVVAAAAARTVSVVSPSGFRVDGLSLDEAAVLLRSLA